MDFAEIILDEVEVPGLRPSEDRGDALGMTATAS